MSKEKRITCPYHKSQYDAFHHICPLNGEPECQNYQVIEAHMPDVDQAYGEYLRDAYTRPAHQKRIPCPYQTPKYEAFHNKCPKNGSIECVDYQLLERRLKDVDQAYAKTQR